MATLGALEPPLDIVLCPTGFGPVVLTHSLGTIAIDDPEKVWVRCTTKEAQEKGTSVQCGIL